MIVAERILLTVAIAIGIVVLWQVYNRLAVRRLAQTAPRDPLLVSLSSRVPTILYFSTQHCAPCKTQQVPALKQLEHEWGERMHVVYVDCEQQPEAADRWGVFSVPTTFVLDSEHKPTAVNRGVASATTLQRQLEAISSITISKGISAA